MLRRFGFTPTEGKAYEALLRVGASTGYAVAREAGLARANAYQALEGLVRQGAARRTSGRPARYTGLEPDDLVAKLERAMKSDLSALQSHLRATAGHARQLPGPAIDVIADAEALAARALVCLESAHEELLAVVGPWMTQLYPKLEALPSRGVNCRLLALGSPGPAGATVREVPRKELLSYWGGLPVAVAADRSRALCGIVHGDGSADAVWTEHRGLVPFLRHLLRRELASPAGRVP